MASRGGGTILAFQVATGGYLIEGNRKVKRVKTYVKIEISIKWGRCATLLLLPVSVLPDQIPFKILHGPRKETLRRVHKIPGKHNARERSGMSNGKTNCSALDYFDIRLFVQIQTSLFEHATKKFHDWANPR